MLSVEALEVRYGGYLALADVSLHVAAGEIVCLMGANGSGKSSLMNAVSGLVTPAAGRVTFDGADITQVPTYHRLARGLAHVLERRRLFPYMTVLENLLLGAYVPALRPARAETLESVLVMFPALRDRQSQLAHTLSGGEQQMVAIGRALMSRPALHHARRAVPRPVAPAGDPGGRDDAADQCRGRHGAVHGAGHPAVALDRRSGVHSRERPASR